MPHRGGVLAYERVDTCVTPGLIRHANRREGATRCNGNYVVSLTI